MASLGFAFGHEQDPVVINATMTPTMIHFSPNTLPENQPFIIHVINDAGAPVELENSDTSVEVYSGMDKTFKVGLPAGEYVFFNDFNTKTKTATLSIKSAQPVVINSTPKPAPQAESVEPSASPSLENTEILFIVWRESVEAFLVIGIVYGWLKQVKTGRRSGLLSLWAGVGLGSICTILLSVILIKISQVLNSNGQNYLQASMTLLAAIMIFYMVKWMRLNGRTLKSEMQTSLNTPPSLRLRNFAILSVVTVAMAREGSEAAIFIYALGFGQQGIVSAGTYGILVLGVILAALTVYVLQLSQRFFSWKTFFKITEILLLILGGGLLLHSIDLLSSAGILPFLHARAWNTSFLLSDNNWIMPMLASFTGYRAMPTFLNVLAYCLYWLMVYLFIYRKSSRMNKPRLCKQK